MKLQQKTQFSLFYLFIALTVLFVIQGWLVAPRPVEIMIMAVWYNWGGVRRGAR